MAIFTNEYGDVLSSSGTRRYVYQSTGYEGTEDLPYFEHGGVIPMNKVLKSENQEELRQIVTDQSNITVMDDNSPYSDFWTVVAVDVNIGERVFSTLVYVWLSCFLIFVIVSYILSRETYRIYLKGEKLERQRKEMIDALAHDLKTPLSIISGYAQNLQEEIHTEKREHYARHINENVERMDKIIRSMFEMSRLESEFFVRI